MEVDTQKRPGSPAVLMEKVELCGATVRLLVCVVAASMRQWSFLKKMP